MKGLVTLCILWVGAFSAFAQSDYVESIAKDRATTDSIFCDTSRHILNQEEIDGFKGLRYFEIDTSYKIEGKFKKKTKKTFEMQTSTKRKPIYRQYGYVKFKLNGTKHKLYIYQRMVTTPELKPASDYLFCPFRDLTNKDSSYGGGRYMDFKLESIKDKTLTIDFNTCYNPYCAYSHRYSCPITPVENTLDVRIEAGVKKWHD